MRPFFSKLVQPGWPRALLVSLLLHAVLMWLLSGVFSSTLPSPERRAVEHAYYAEDDEETTVRLEARTSPQAPKAPPKKALAPEARLFSPVLFEPGPEINTAAPGTAATENMADRASGISAALPAGAATTFFDVPARGRKIVYLIDASSSMGPGGAWTAAGRELLASIARLPPDARFQVLVYNRRVSPLLPRYPDWLPTAPNVLRQIAQALQQLEPAGGTDHGPALRAALQLRPDALYFLTDADDLSPEHLRLAVQQNRGRAVIHTIELNPHNRGRTFMPMQVLARDHGGNYQAVNLGKLPPTGQPD